MSHRAWSICILSCLGCANARDDSRFERQSAPRAPAGDSVATQQPESPAPPSLCPLSGYECVSEFSVGLEASEPWPLGRYFLRVALNRGPSTVCEIAFEPVIGAVTNTCDDEEHGFRVDYRYDGETRAIESVNFGSVRHVDLEILVAENLPPLVEVHHDVVVQKCTYDCARGEPLAARVQLSPAAPPDAGADAGDALPDAALDAAR